MPVPAALNTGKLLLGGIWAEDTSLQAKKAAFDSNSQRRPIGFWQYPPVVLRKIFFIAATPTRIPWLSPIKTSGMLWALEQAASLRSLALWTSWVMVPYAGERGWSTG